MPRGLDSLKTFRDHPTWGLPEASKKVRSKDAFRCKWGESPVWAMRKKQCYWPYLRSRGGGIPGNQWPANFTGNPACFHLFALSSVYPIYPQSGSPQGGKVELHRVHLRSSRKGARPVWTTYSALWIEAASLRLTAEWRQSQEGVCVLICRWKQGS